MNLLKKISITISFIFTVLFIVAQKQANIWYFGNYTGLDFNQSPPNVLGHSGTYTIEGCTSIADRNGKLQFYSNGLTVMNRLHHVMANGDSLMGDLSSTNNAVAVPFPANDSLYYLFTIGARDEFDKGLRYNIINMNGDSGNGIVVQKNVLIESTTVEKIAAVRHCNKKDVWIMTRKWDTDEYHAYLVSAAGVNTAPIISHTGFNPVNPIGTLKFSADGKQLAGVFSVESNMVELMKFDNQTGLLSNALKFQPYPLSGFDFSFHCYGAEFSPNGKLLYISSNTSDIISAELFQFDISSNDPATILASKQVIYQSIVWNGGGLQMGPDHKIYMTNSNDTSLSVVEDPDMPGAACNFRYNKLFIAQYNPVPSQYDFPTFIQSYFDPDSNPFDFSRTGNCLDKDVTFNINRLSGIDSVKWDFGDGRGSASQAPIHHFNSPGYYDVKLIVYKVDCSGVNDTAMHTIWIADNPYFLGADTGSCSTPSLQLGVNAVTEAFYLWNTGEGTNSIMVSGFGAYWLSISQNGCKLADSINVYQKTSPGARIAGENTVCLNMPITLSAAKNSATDYLWNTGETTPFISANHAGNYNVTMTINSCIVKAAIELFWGDCGAFIPSAFSPNGDGVNDQFGVASGFAARDFYMEVFDRWGNTVFITSNNTKQWDGTHNGKAVPSGAYSWILKYTDSKGIRYFKQGTVLLVR